MGNKQQSLKIRQRWAKCMSGNLALVVAIGFCNNRKSSFRNLNNQIRNTKFRYSCWYCCCYHCHFHLATTVINWMNRPPRRFGSIILFGISITSEAACPVIWRSTKIFVAFSKQSPSKIIFWRKWTGPSLPGKHQAPQYNFLCKLCDNDLRWQVERTSFNLFAACSMLS